MIIRVHRWAIWWFCLGVICGAVALINIFFRDLSRMQEKVILFVGVVHWLLGGLVCWAWEGIKLDKAMEAASKPASEIEGQLEPDAASNVVIQAHGQALPRATHARKEPMVAYLLRQWEQKLGHRP
jgi:hypothetical protein